MQQRERVEEGERYEESEKEERKEVRERAGRCLRELASVKMARGEREGEVFGIIIV